MIGGPIGPEEARRGALQAIWTFPSVVASAFMLAWGAEAAQFYVSQGLALAILAWLQVMPEFAVEAVIAWNRDIPLMTANFTGALRLLTGLGWPMIWVVSALARRSRGEADVWRPIALDEEHAAQVVGLIPPLLYWGWIIAKGTLGLADAGVLIALYVAFLMLVNRIPPRAHEELGDVAAAARAVIGLDTPRRWIAIAALFVVGGLLLFAAARPFLVSMIGLATVLGISQFVFVQWVAPFLSELPEFVTTTYWARGRGKGGMALMNMASSNINQWTMLAAMLPIVYSISLGHVAAVPIGGHRDELILTLLQGTLGMILLANLDFAAHEALGLLVLFLIQFFVPHWRAPISVVYAVWLGIEVISAVWRPGRLRAFAVFPRLWRRGAAAAA
ncbi:MAG: hypothetical protein HY076_07090 [Candidatus Eisenbacteria bacterium]|uniref:Sodium/calcium exchanger membrane region domain-containing protein n=1 Tax=Eiseniibacteriota bacterium TaxID=2212470 RepID=A0A9D6QKB2_UNCEI|nr:hypothetical protein [Candidatus Eisenbacteria bacterium]MBI3540021.1 hypothetical protein [Candidatus Eisenbacteria bacterium]